MTCYRVLNVLNVHVVCVLPVVHTPILICFITLQNVSFKTNAVDHIYRCELTISFQLVGVPVLRVQPTVFFKIYLSHSINISVKERCR